MTSVSLRTATAIQDWKQAVHDQVDDIGAYRRVASEERVWWPLPDPPRNFYTMTERLLVWMAEHHPGVDLSAVHRVYQAIQSVHNGAGVDDLPPQGALEAMADSAVMVLNIALEAILAKKPGAKPAVGKGKRSSRTRAPRSKYQPPPCPKCGGKARVTSTHEALRYLKCSECDHNWPSAK